MVNYLVGPRLKISSRYLFQFQYVITISVNNDVTRAAECAEQYDKVTMDMNSYRADDDGGFFVNGGKVRNSKRLHVAQSMLNLSLSCFSISVFREQD